MFEQVRRFPCPSCQQIIADDAAQCRYCGAPVDKAIAQAAADTQDKVNQACSDASYLKVVAGGMWVFLGASFLRIVAIFSVGFIVTSLFIITFLVLAFLLARWQLRFSNINTADPDYAQARRAKNASFLLWLGAIPVGFIIKPLLALLSNRPI